MISSNLAYALSPNESMLDRIKNNIVHLRDELFEQKMQNEQLRLEYERLKEQYDVLLAKDKSTHEIISHIGHELRTPLNAIIGLSSLLKEHIDHTQKPTKVNYATVIYDSGLSLFEIIDQLLDYSRLQVEDIEIKTEEVNLKQLMQDIASWVQPLCASKMLNFDLFIDPSIESVITEESKLIQMIKQFLNNALKFTQSGSITLELLKPSSTSLGYAAEICIHDTGFGISENKLKQIVIQFENKKSQILKKHEVGIVLKIYHELAKLLGIKICIMSDVSKGTSIHLLIPFDSCLSPFEKNIEISHKNQDVVLNDYPQVDNVISDWIPSMQLNNDPHFDRLMDYSDNTLLLVDDNVKNLFTITSVLQDHGYDVLTAINGKDAIEKLKHRTVRAVLTDLSMPEMNGYELTQYIRSHETLKNTPIIIISANYSKDAKENSFAFGANQFLTKPFDISSLLTSVRSYVHPVKNIL